MIKPAIRRLWREPGVLQLGVDPARAVVLSGCEATVRTVLRLLDGSCTREDVPAQARRLGVPPQAAEHLVGLLEHADLLDFPAPPEPDSVCPRPEREREQPELASLSLVHPGAGAAQRVLRRRGRLHVDVRGGNRLGAPVANLLQAAGVGLVTLDGQRRLGPADVLPGGWRPEHVGLTESEAWSRMATGRAAPGRPADADADLVLVAGEPDAASRAQLQREGAPYLVVAVREAVAAVGPLVVPGVTACLQCLQLYRADRDPAWPLLAAQLDQPHPGVEACDTALAVAACALAAGQALAFLDGSTCQAIAGVLELPTRSWQMRRRHLRIHPACGCGWTQSA